MKDTSEVKGSSVRDTLMKILTPRKDEQSKTIRNRIKDVDLVQVKARYHKKCYTNLQRRNNECGDQLGRPTTKVDKVMQIIFSFIAESRDVCQFAVKDLLQLIPEDDQPSIETVTTRLQQEYRDRIITTNVSGVGNVIFFQSEAGQKLLSDAFYASRKKNAKAEKERLTREIARVIGEKIRCKYYKSNPKDYPPTTTFMNEVERDVPMLLRILLEEIILPGKKMTAIPVYKKKITAIAHAIIQLARPRCFRSKVLLSIGCYLKKKSRIERTHRCFSSNWFLLLLCGSPALGGLLSGKKSAYTFTFCIFSMGC